MKLNVRLADAGIRRDEQRRRPIGLYSSIASARVGPERAVDAQLRAGSDDVERQIAPGHGDAEVARRRVLEIHAQHQERRRVRLGAAAHQQPVAARASRESSARSWSRSGRGRPARRCRASKAFDVEGHADVPREQRVEAPGVARRRSPRASTNAGAGSAVRRRAWRARLPRCERPPRSPPAAAAVAHRLGGLVALVDQLGGPPPVERSELLRAAR